MGLLSVLSVLKKNPYFLQEWWFQHLKHSAYRFCDFKTQTFHRWDLCLVAGSSVVLGDMEGHCSLSCPKRASGPFLWLTTEVWEPVANCQENWGQKGATFSFLPPWQLVDPARAYCWCFIKRVDLGNVVFAMQCHAKPWFPAFIYKPNCCYGNSIFKEVIIADLVACVHFWCQLLAL